MKWMERQKYFLDLTLSSLWRRKGKNLSLLMVYALMVFMVASVIFFSGAIRNEAREVLADAPEMVVQRMVAGRHDLIPESYVETVKKIRGIRSVAPRLWGYYHHPAARANYTLMAPEKFPHGDDATVIGRGVLRTWGKGTSGSNQLFFKAYNGETVVLNVVEVFDGATELVSSDLILVSEPVFRRITGVPEGMAVDLVAEIRNPKEASTIAGKLVRELPDTRPILRDEIHRTYDSLFDRRSGYVIVLLGGSVLAFLIFAWEKAAGPNTEERTEIGILKGIGWDTSDILVMKFWEGAVISLSAFLLGSTAAYVHVFIASAPLFEHALKGWAVLYPEFELRPVYGMHRLAVLFALTVLPYTFITIVPSWKIAVSDPDVVMRQG